MYSEANPNPIAFTLNNNDNVILFFDILTELFFKSSLKAHPFSWYQQCYGHCNNVHCFGYQKNVRLPLGKLAKISSLFKIFNREIINVWFIRSFIAYCNLFSLKPHYHWILQLCSYHPLSQALILPLTHSAWSWLSLVISRLLGSFICNIHAIRKKHMARNCN